MFKKNGRMKRRGKGLLRSNNAKQFLSIYYYAHASY